MDSGFSNFGLVDVQLIGGATPFSSSSAKNLAKQSIQGDYEDDCEGEGEKEDDGRSRVSLVEGRPFGDSGFVPFRSAGRRPEQAGRLCHPFRGGGGPALVERPRPAKIFATLGQRRF